MLGGDGSGLMALAIVRYSFQHFTCMLPTLYSYGKYILSTLQGHYKIKQKLQDL